MTGTTQEISIETVQRRHKGHWFDPDTMKFFRTSLGRAFEGPGGTFFVTSEVPPFGDRQWSVRQQLPSGNMATIDEFGKFGDGRSAETVARRLAATSVEVAA